MQHIGLQRESEEAEFIALFGDGKSIDLQILSLAEPEGACLRHIDPYGATVFNQLQLPTLIEELLVLKSKAPDQKFLSSIDDVLDFLRESEEVHVHLRFVGD